MKIGEFDATGLFILDRTRSIDNGDSYVCLRKTGFYIGANAARDLDLGNSKYKFIAFIADQQNPLDAERLYLVPNNEANFENNSKISDGIRHRKHKRMRTMSDAKSCSCQDIFKSIPRLGKLIAEKDRKKRRFKLHFDEVRNGRYICLNPSFEFNMKEISKLPEEKGIYRLIDSYEDVCYIGQASNIKTRVSSHKSDGLNFNKIEFSLISNKDERDKWESHFIDQFSNERGRLPVYNFQNGNNFSKYINVASTEKEVLDGTTS